MTTLISRVSALGACLLVLSGTTVFAQNAGFAWEGELELGYETVFSSNVPGNTSDTFYGIGSLDASYGFGNGLTVFGGVTLEELSDAVGNTGYGLYVHELGLEFASGIVTVRGGKVSPVFGTGWDEAHGFYGSALADDYELSEQIGILADFDLGTSGVLSVGTFFADTSTLSRSAGFDRGRALVTTGGAGNTEKLDNAAIQWTGTFGDTRLWVGARHLSAGVGDVSDETGGVAAIAHDFGQTFSVFAEVASFDGYGGTADNATYATLSGAYTVGDWTLSAALARRDVTSLGVTEVATVGADYAITEDITIGGAFAAVNDAGTRDRQFGISVVIPFGG